MITRTRTIQPTIFSSPDVRALPVPARWTFIGLLFYVDDYGNESADAALVKAAIWPGDRAITEAKVREHMSLIAAREMLTFYEVDGRPLMRITNWHKHMRVDRPSKSNIPPDPAREPLLATEGGEGAGSGREDGEPGEGDGSEGEHSRAEHALTREAPSPFCSAHPNGTTKPCKACGNARLRLKAWENAREEAGG